MEGGMEIDPILIVLQLIPFLVVLVGLHFIIFKPLLKVLEERDRNIVEDRRDAEFLDREVTQKMEQLEDKLAEARALANEQRKSLREEIRVSEQEILDRARKESEILLADARRQIATEREAASRALAQETENLSRDIATSVLGRQV
jgi:F-type H+-transporting ATPase subunit b